MQPRKPTKILYTFLAVILSLTILPLMTISWKLIGIGRESMRLNERAEQLRSVVLVANELRTYVGGYRHQIAGMARTLEAIGGAEVLLRQEESARNRQLAQFLEDDANLILLGIAPRSSEADTRLVAQWDSKKILGEEVRDTVGEALKAVSRRLDRTYVSTPRYIRSSNEFAIVLAHPLHKADTTPDQPEVVLAVVSLEPIFNLVNVTSASGNLNHEALLRNGSRVVFLVDQQGRILAHPDRALVYTPTNVSDWGIVAKWQDTIAIDVSAPLAEPFEIRLGNDRLPMLGSCATALIAPELPLGVIAVINEEAAYSSVTTMIWQASILTVVTALVAAGVGLLLAYWVTSPIAAVAHGARAIAGGDFARRIAVRSRSEIGQLAEDFNAMAEQIQRYITDLRFAVNENRELFLGTVKALAEAIDGKDPYTRGHSERVKMYSVLMAEHMGLNAEEIEDIRVAALLHDVGKIGIEDRILKKPAALTEEEYTIMKTHPEKGAKIMAEIPQMKKYVPGMYYHHECMDGRGYPIGLKGDQIPLMARIISVADTFDAMTTNRPYQRAMTPEVAVQKIWSFAGTRYDPNVVAALESALKAGKLDEVIHGYQMTLAAGKA
ncbi:HD domain-containing phosphohydrolase [Chloracidobacterium aggregatum]|jgi:putative nucleotidyltransferase with HDIG domain|uniref:HD domain-containing protein n=1 Tax=Chloracidobacterium sp. N TaxID=2821540 RepID=A0ABX8B5K7_9BACT|nr:HD domain-containing phosphohydrolase [Chloracidobacterium aggregatum]QUV84878.1 HD domain-containing protein [Chloracidobacterium sp. 2]QUV88718.1 HD domain-containing protein [Chloracidobacterium sp. S]QUV91637.1 HD domain-containing protein [Chloracidobacterium sp. A]QUV94814.1 HD domain-containing protein [Chloracidobacterium sp. N]QUV95925.1 HD domain-containing protein [Chloracidobacterium sp. E]